MSRPTQLLDREDTGVRCLARRVATALVALVFAHALVVAAAAARQSASPATAPAGAADGRAAIPPAVQEHQGILFRQLTADVWMHTSDHEVQGWGRVSSNGLLVSTTQALWLVDTAWTDAQTIVVLDWAAQTFGRPVTAAIFTHAHLDRMGGVGAVRERGIATWAHPRSNALAPSRGLMPAAHDLLIDEHGEARAVQETSSPGASDARLLMFYPGAAHTEDNIVVAVAGAGVVFGGCTIRAAGSTSLGNMAEADVTHWATAVDRVIRRFPHADIVVPGHGAPGGRELLSLTKALAGAAAEAAGTGAAQRSERR